MEKAQAVEAYGRLPLSFEANTGQANLSVKFLASGSGYGLYLAGQEAVLALHRGDCAAASPGAGFRPALPFARRQGLGTNDPGCARRRDLVRMRLAGVRGGTAAPLGEEQLPGTANYFIGNNPSRWHTGVPTYARVRYAGVYPGIDLVYYGNQRQLEYDFVVAPGSSPDAIRLRFSGTRRLRLDRDGNLVLTTSGGSLAFYRPTVYQERNGERQAVAGRFMLRSGNTAGFALGSYDHSRPLVIDPVLAYSTYLGGSGKYGSDGANAIALDVAGNAYVAGVTCSTDFPVTKGANQTTSPGNDTCSAFVTKMNPTGSALVYSTYLGGSGYPGGPGDVASAIAVDKAGNAYVAGSAWSTNFPVTSGALQSTNNAAEQQGSNAFLTKLNPAGTALVYSTYLGGSGNKPQLQSGVSLGDSATGLALDSAGNAYLTGQAYSHDFPVTTGALQPVNNATNNNTSNAFAAKINAAGSGLVYSTYLGGSGYYNWNLGMESGDQGNALSLDSSGNAYIAGSTSSADFPVTKGAFQSTYKAATNQANNAFVAKLNPTGTKLVYSTYLGGGGYPSSGAPTGDTATGLALDNAGDAYVTGYTYSTDFPVTKGAFQSSNKAAASGYSNAFVTKLNPTGTALVYSTYLGGSDEWARSVYFGDRGNALALDSAGDAYVTGYTNTADFPVTKDAFQCCSLGTNAFITKLNPTGTALVYSTYLGGSGGDGIGDFGQAISLDGAGNAYIAGQTSSYDFPITKGAFQSTNPGSPNGMGSAFVAKFSLSAPPAITKTTLLSSANPALAGSSVTFTATVAASPSGAPSLGKVTMTVDGKTVATGAANTAVTYMTSSLAVGTHPIAASFSDTSGGFAPSSASLTETIDSAQTSSPAIQPAHGSYAAAQLVTVSDATKGATIYYTTDGSTPATSSARYTAPLLVAASETVKAVAAATGYTNSAVTSATYTVTGWPTGLAAPATAVATPKATLNAFVNTLGLAGSYYFQYGTGIAALNTATAKTALGATAAPVPVSAQVAGLASKTKYFYQVVVTTAAGTGIGAVESFTTN